MDGFDRITHPGQHRHSTHLPALFVENDRRLLKSDPVAYMTAELRLVKDFLEGADSISSVLEVRAGAVAA